MDKLLTTSLALFLLTGCATAAKEKLPEPISTAQVVGSHYVTLSFEAGQTGLTEINKRELNELAQKAGRDGRAIEEIRILTWADKEYPTTSRRMPPKDIILAKERAKIIKKYIREDLHASEKIDSYNMAKRPNLLSRALKGDERTVKEAFEQSGATASRLPDGQVSYTKASKALVIIDYQ